MSKILLLNDHRIRDFKNSESQLTYTKYRSSIHIEIQKWTLLGEKNQKSPTQSFSDGFWVFQMHINAMCIFAVHMDHPQFSKRNCRLFFFYLNEELLRLRDEITLLALGKAQWAGTSKIIPNFRGPFYFFVHFKSSKKNYTYSTSYVSFFFLWG